MQDQNPKDKPQYPVSRLERVDQVCDEYERQWNAGELPEIESFLEDADEDDRELLLRNLVALDLSLRSESGEDFDPEDYKSRFIEQGDIIDSVVDLFLNREPKSSTGTDGTAMKIIPDPGAIIGDIPKTVGRNDRYQIIRVLGRGGFACVYLALDTDLDREVAIKIPRLERFDSAAAVDFLFDEARKAAQLDHRGIVQVYDVQREQDLVYIVQQYVDGGDLTRHVQTRRVPHRQIVEWMIAIAEAVGYAHSGGWLHLDLKPANILVDSDDKPYVADFGLALHESSQKGMEGRVLGSFSYMSPAQTRGEAHRLDGRADIWSLGVILYELLTGYRPFQGETREEIFHQINNYEPTPPRQIDPKIPAELSRISLICLSKRSTDRYCSTAELIDDLRHCLQSLSQAGELPGTTASGGMVDATRGALASIVPQGLRSFEAEHSDFYLQLLPGPHDREGLPKGVRFWKTQIEKTDADETFSVGLMYGPSGCGKSSLVKAALIPGLY